jgi:formate dehydrogenase beta subunit
MSTEETIKLNIDGHDVETQAGKTVLEAALDAEIYIPHLCHHPDLSPIGACRLCVVEIEGVEGIQSSCVTPAEDGMTVHTKTEQVERLRHLAMELILAGHPADCGSCNKYLNCELQSLKQYLGCEELTVRTRSKLLPLVNIDPLFVRDPNKCVACGRCVRACHELRGVGVLYYAKKGRETLTDTISSLPLADAGCRFCGACAEVCPTGAIQDKEELVKSKNRRHALIPCRYNCPAEIDVPRYLRFIRQNDYAAATAVIREKVPFPGVLGYVCDHPCEDVCRRGEINQAISIRELKRYAVEHDVERTWEKNYNEKPATGKRAAIIGAGPAGLSAAYYLARQGHEVTVFEALPQAGGMLRYGIPEYRLPREIIDSEISDIEKTGVEIKTGTRIESIDKLLEQGYDAVLVSVGTHKGQRLRIPGADSEDILINTDMLREVHLGNKLNVGEKVVVIGGGNVAFDCARVAKRLGAKEVHIACLECRENMPASSDEIEQGEEEDITVHPAHTATQILSEDGKITGVEFLDVESFYFDEDNNPQIEVIEGSQHVIEADTVIFAIGQQPEIPEGFGLDTKPGNLIELDLYTFTTNRDGVFAAGDAVSGTSSVIKAIAGGRKAAIAMDRFLEGSGIIDEKLAPVVKAESCLGPNKEFAGMSRHDAPCIIPDERLQSFCKVVGEMDEETATDEASRCLQCDLRLQITSVRFWGDY